jgi:hypothetical protein
VLSLSPMRRSLGESGLDHRVGHPLPCGLIRCASRWTERIRGFYGAFRERLSTIFFVFPSQLPTTFGPFRSPLVMMVSA